MRVSLHLKSKCLKLGALGILLSIACVSSAWAWGPTGHKTIGKCAAILIHQNLSQSDDAAEQSFGVFYGDHADFFGEGSNIPDAAWRNQNRPISNQVSSPDHYINAEIIAGIPDPNHMDVFFAKLLAIPSDYQVLRQTYDGTPSQLTGKPFFVYDIGTAPWRAQELFDLLVSALQSYAEKARTNSDQADLAHPVALPFNKVDESKVKTVNDLPVPSYVPNATQNRFSDLNAAAVIAAVEAHFVQDLTQPYHASSNHDGWLTGNGGIHAYFESMVVDALGAQLESDVTTLASDPVFQRKMWEKLGTDQETVMKSLQQSSGLTDLLKALTKDSISRMKDIVELDDQFAVIQKGGTLPWGQEHSEHPDVKPATRKPANDPQVVQAFRPILNERLAMGVVILQAIWTAAWQKAGRPNLDLTNPLTKQKVQLTPPIDPPFLWPTYDNAALQRSIDRVRSGGGMKQKVE